MKHYIVGIIVIILGGYYAMNIYQEKQNFEQSYFDTKHELLAQKTHSKRTENKKILEKDILEAPQITEKKTITKINYDTANLEVDFYPQSPFGEWGPIFEDTCEEASVLLAMNYVRGNYMTKKEFKEELLKIVDWENKYFGYFKDTNVQETTQIIEKYFEYTHYNILENPSIEDIKGEIAKGNIIVAPFYAKNLNPYYVNGGPDYHMMVIKGYTKNSFIVHDVGTKMGEDYYYNQNTLYNRIHDFHGEDIQKGEKKIIVIQKDIG